MSTKSSLAYSESPDFHFYHEAFDDDAVYLDISDVEFEARRNGLMIRIPLEIWECIRHLGGADFQWAGQTDAQIEQYVEQEVDRRIEKYGDNKILNLLGIWWYGGVGANAPREEQVEAFKKHLFELREKQERMMAQIKQFWTINDSID